MTKANVASISLGKANEWPQPRAWELRSILPHVFVLGAGASKAACARDKNGLLVPVMNELGSIPEIRASLPRRCRSKTTKDFESLYVALKPNERPIVQEAVRSYFQRLELPDSVTIYDVILLGLRPKDVVATFNWDPLLEQARRRNLSAAKLPRILYLHGNVTQGYCRTCRSFGLAGTNCGSCDRRLTRMRLLYPIKKKNYQTLDIAPQWDELKKAIATAYFLTVFGYRAPASDVEARDVMVKTFDSNFARMLAEFHVIDIRNKRELKRQWSTFPGRTPAIGKSLLHDWWFMDFPRRSCEALAQATLANDPWNPNRVPRYRRLRKLQEWIRPLVVEEKLVEAGVINDLSGRTCIELHASHGCLSSARTQARRVDSVGAV